jgi:hypothetical protein
MRLVAAFSERIAEIDPASPLRPRIEGLTKHLWTTTQLALRQAADAFDHLDHAGIPFIVFKGGALHAEGFGPSCRRILGDVDLLVHHESAEGAIDALTRGGWSSVNGESATYLRRLARVRISGNYRKGRHGDVDLHITPFHFSKSGKALEDALWQRARPNDLALRSVLIPDPADAIVISLAHAPLSSSGDWAVDIVTRIANQAIDWDELVGIAMERALVPSCLAGLRYLHDALEVAVPATALAALSEARVGTAVWLKFASNVSDRRNRPLTHKAINRVADHLLGRLGYSYYRKDRTAVTVSRAMSPIRRAWPARKLPVLPSELGFSHEVAVDRARTGRRLLVSLAVSQPLMSRRIFFDVSVDGVAVARWRARAGPTSSAEKRMTFSLQLPHHNQADLRVTIEARPAGFVPPHADDQLRSTLGPIKFRLLGASTI